MSSRSSAERGLRHRRRCRRRRRSRSTSISSAASAATCSSPRWSTRCRRSPRRSSPSSRRCDPRDEDGARVRRNLERRIARAALRARAGVATRRLSRIDRRDQRRRRHRRASMRARRTRRSAAALPRLPLSAPTREHALALLALLADAEAQVHGIPVDDVHFHELADWDSLLDVVAAGCIAAALSGARWTASSLPLGRRHGAHGAWPAARSGAGDEPAARRVIRGTTTASAASA